MRLHAGRGGGNAAGFLRARPLACGCFAFALGVLAAKLALLDGSVFGAAAAMGAAGLLLFARAGRGMIAVALCFLLGGANCAARLAVPEMPACGKWTAEGVICSDPAVYGGFARCYLRDVTVYTEEGGAQRLRGTLYCFLAADAESGLRYGDRVRVRGRSYELRGERNPGGFNERLTLGRGGAHVRMYVSEPAEKLADAAFSVRGLAYAVRHALAERMEMEPQKLYDFVLENTGMGCGAMKFHGPKIISGNREVAFAADLALKDLLYAKKLFDHYNAPSFTLDGAITLLRTALKDGGKGKDITVCTEVMKEYLKNGS